MGEAKRPYDPRGRLAAVVSKAFPGQSAATTRALRLAAVSQTMGHEVTSFKDLADAEVEALLTTWEQFDQPYSPSESSAGQLRQLAIEYQRAHGQTDIELS